MAQKKMASNNNSIIDIDKENIVISPEPKSLVQAVSDVNEILGALYQLQKDNRYCDTEIILASGERIFAHCIVLVVNSSTIEHKISVLGISSDDTRRYSINLTDLYDISKSELDCLLEFCYTGFLNCSLYLENVLKLADYLGVQAFHKLYKQLTDDTNISEKACKSDVTADHVSADSSASKVKKSQISNPRKRKKQNRKQSTGRPRGRPRKKPAESKDKDDQVEAENGKVVCADFKLEIGTQEEDEEEDVLEADSDLEQEEVWQPVQKKKKAKSNTRVFKVSGSMTLRFFS